MGQAEAGAGGPSAEEPAEPGVPVLETDPIAFADAEIPETPATAEPDPEPEIAGEPDEVGEPVEPVEPGGSDVVEPEPPIADGDAVRRGLDDLLAAVSRVDDRIAERDRLAARDRDLIDKLHAENQRLRTGETFAVIAPVARDLVRLRDQLLQLDAAAPEPGRSDAALIEPQLLGILARLGVEPYAPVEGDTFDATLHQGVGRTKTADADLDGKVAAVRREGFTAPDGRPLRAAEVEVWQHVPIDPEPEPGGT